MPHKDPEAARAYFRQYRLDNLEKKKATDRRLYLANKDERNRNAAAYYIANRPAIDKGKKAWNARNAEKIAEQKRQRRLAKLEIIREARRQHYRENKARYVAQARQREKHIKQATPAWADLEKIAEFYVEAARLTELTGIKHHVDHIYPLRSKWMCGLHVETNLQIIHAVVNLKKSNSIPLI